MGIALEIIDDRYAGAVDAFNENVVVSGRNSIDTNLTRLAAGIVFVLAAEGDPHLGNFGVRVVAGDPRSHLKGYDDRSLGWLFDAAGDEGKRPESGDCEVPKTSGGGKGAKSEQGPIEYVHDVDGAGSVLEAESREPTAARPRPGILCRNGLGVDAGGPEFFKDEARS